MRFRFVLLLACATCSKGPTAGTYSGSYGMSTAMTVGGPQSSGTTDVVIERIDGHHLRLNLLGCTLTAVADTNETADVKPATQHCVLNGAAITVTSGRVVAGGSHIDVSLTGSLDSANGSVVLTLNANRK